MAIIKQVVTTIIVIVVCFSIGYSIHTQLGRPAMMLTFAGFFTLTTLYLMYKNLALILLDGEGSIGWLVALAISFPLAIYAINKITGYFDFH